METEVTEIVQGILSLLKKSGKLPLLPRIVECLSGQVEEEKVAYVALAVKPTPEEEKKIEAYVNKIFGRTVKVMFEINPQLLAGLTIRFGDKFFDQSLRGKLKDLKENFNYGY